MITTYVPYLKIGKNRNFRWGGHIVLSVRFGGQFISGGVHISFVREADIEHLQLFGKIFRRALRGLRGADI